MHMHESTHVHKVQSSLFYIFACVILTSKRCKRLNKSFICTDHPLLHAYILLCAHVNICIRKKWCKGIYFVVYLCSRFISFLCKQWFYNLFCMYIYIFLHKITNGPILNNITETSQKRITSKRSTNVVIFLSSSCSGRSSHKISSYEIKSQFVKMSQTIFLIMTYC